MSRVFKITEATLVSVINYLGTKPYNESARLIAELGKAELVDDVPVVDVEPKTRGRKARPAVEVTDEQAV